ncbi:hypothetical_protein [Candidozyma auris]|uniref:cohesin subunit SMC1 n=1 Tax=Candidozyma auris TaxID=498019 RepID=UPI00125986CE|nr:hypothetical_protein [[Candida] auris]QEO23403.1 hypothetical_protein [[Candida] auris]
MGKLLGLELHNFKSYKGTANVGFGDANFTSIIGPNGAGKSNMMDAISFVLGVQSFHLRSSGLKDLIYRGRIGEYETTQNCDLAYVRAIYEKSNGERMVLQRSINATGTSDYKINDKSVTALQYTMILKEENILVKARNFLVFQGDIENVASQEPKQLANLIETISGSAQYAADYDTLLEEKNKAVELHAEVFSRKRNLTTESKHVSERVLNHRRNLAASEVAFKNLAAETSAQELQVKKLEQSIADLRQRMEEAKRGLLPSQSSKKLLENKIAFTKKKIDDLENDIRAQSDQEEKFAELEQQINIPKEGVNEYEALRGQYLTDSGSQLESDLAIVNADRESLEISLKDLQLQREQSASRVLELESKAHVNLGSTLHDLNARIQDIDSMISAKWKEKEALQKRQEVASFKMLEFNSELKDVLSRLEELSSDQKETKKQRELRDNVAMLRSVLPEGSIKGLLYDLVQATQRKYELALSTVLGADYDSIVVDTTATAHKCIDILKERRAGLASFIPLNSVVNEPMNLNYLRSLHEEARSAIDVVKYDDPTIERAVQYAAGNAIIVENLDIARELKWNFHEVISCKFVSIDGSVIHKSGLMTGGQQEKRAGATARWGKNEMNQLLKRKDEIASALERIAKERPSAIETNSLTEEISQLEALKPSLRSRAAVLERQIFEANQEVAFLKEGEQEIDDKVRRKQEDLGALKSEIESYESQIQEVKRRIYSNFCDKYGLSSISDYELTHGTALRGRVREKTEFEKSITSLKNQISFHEERRNETIARKERLENDIARSTSDFKRLHDEIKKAEEKLHRIEQDIEEESINRSVLVEALQTKMREASIKESEMKEIEYEVKNLTRELGHFEETLLKVDADRYNMIKNCKIEDIDLPLEDGFLDAISLDVENTSHAVYQVHIDYSLLESRLKDSYSVRTEAEIRAKIENMENELHTLTPNAKALERLQEVDQKLKDFDREFSKAKHNVNRSTSKFNEVRDKRKELFMDAFNHISDRIDKVYKSLTSSTTSSLGGSAYLTLEDDEEPFSAGIKYHAMPPLKRFRDMELLSGGEKTMAALALLFAIHSYHPSPFFVLDEIDASLDNGNVKKIARYIKENSGPGFQFIVISLKSTMFENSEALVGIYRDQRENCSKTIGLDLRQYPEEQEKIAIPESHQIAAAET